MVYSQQYLDVLNSDEWRKKKFARLRKVGGCEHRRRFLAEWLGTGCRGRIEGHHLTYERLGREREGDFILLCERHHRIAERKKHKAREHKAIKTFRRKHRKIFGKNLTYTEAQRKYHQWIKSNGKQHSF